MGNVDQAIMEASNYPVRGDKDNKFYRQRLRKIFDEEKI